MHNHDASHAQTATDPQQMRRQIRRQIRHARNALTEAQQATAAQQLVQQFLGLPELPQSQHIAIYLHNDGEIATTPLIQALWQLGKSLYLPVLHPVVPGYLLFQRYEIDTPLLLNQYQILEPALACHQTVPLAELDLILTPLVAFDKTGQRIGMGGGYYDRTFGNNPSAQQRMIGLAHNCQLIESIPTEAWDVPLPKVITPQAVHVFN